jgi:hypothetical protein
MGSVEALPRFSISPGDFADHELARNKAKSCKNYAVISVRNKLAAIALVQGKSLVFGGTG